MMPNAVTLLREVNYGSRARLGMLLPSGNAAAEPEILAMLPRGISLHASRLKLTGSSLQQLLGMVERVEEAAALVSDAAVDLLAFHCTAVSTLNEELETSIARRAQEASGRPVVTTAQAIIKALEAVGARRIVLITPYIDEINQREIDFLERHGIEVLAASGLGLNTPQEMLRIEPRAWHDCVLQQKRADADAYFISCTAIRTAGVIEALEAALERPVITSNQTLAWHSLRTLGLDERVAGFGWLLGAH